jgi:hypothetical protein
MANTTIQLKYSDVTSEPTSLANGEVAYSNSSNKLWVGQSNGVVAAIGGKYYTALVDAATSANTASAIVKRDADGNFTAATITANVTGNATTATQWKTARTLGVSGDATGTMSVNGTSDQNISLVLANTAVTAGTYGGTTQIPTFVVDSKGRLTSAGNVAVATAASFLNAAADTGTANISLSSDTLTITGRDGIDTLAVDANNTILIDVDNTVLRTTGNQTKTGDLTVTNLGVTGNLTVAGTYVTQDVTNVSTEDPLIQLAANNTANIVDIGLFGEANTGSSTIYTALFRDATDGKYKLLTDGTELPTSTVNVTAFSTATLVADLETSGSVTVRGTNLLDKSNTTLTLTQAAFDKANTANTTADASFAKANTANTTADAAFAKANTANTTADASFAKANSANVLAQLAFDKANTDVTSISTSVGTHGSASIVPVIYLEANGRVSSVTNTTIAIGASAITSGTLGVARGGTGAATFTTKGVIVSDNTTGTNALSALTSATEGHVLQINASGIPSLAHLNGGSF